MSNAPLNIGFIGTGWMGSALLARLVGRDDVRIAAIHEIDRAQAEAVTERFELPAGVLVDDFDQVVDHPEVDAVFVCTPNSYHRPAGDPGYGGRQARFLRKALRHHVRRIPPPKTDPSACRWTTTGVFGVRA